MIILKHLSVVTLILNFLSCFYFNGIFGKSQWTVDEVEEAKKGLHIHYITDEVKLAAEGLAPELKYYDELDYNEIKTELYALQKKCPDIIKIHTAREMFPYLDMAPDYFTCNGKKKCEIFNVEVKNHFDDTYRPEAYIVAGIHGDERVGPVVATEFLSMLCHMYAKHPIITQFVNTRTIWVTPIANPYGYTRYERDENGIDPNRDFPYGVQTCLNTVAAKNIHELFRQHLFQIALPLHAGSRGISWPWGTKHYMQRESPPLARPGPDAKYQEVLGKLLQEVGGITYEIHPYGDDEFDHNDNWSLAHSLNFFPIGLSGSMFGPAEGTFEDWAYGASWDYLFDEGRQVPERCATKEGFGTVPADITNYMRVEGMRCLTFLIEIGKVKAPLKTLYGHSTQFEKPGSYDGYVPRTLRVLMKAIEFVNPATYLAAPPIYTIDNKTSTVKFEMYFNPTGCFSVELGYIIYNGTDIMDPYAVVDEKSALEYTTVESDKAGADNLSQPNPSFLSTYTKIINGVETKLQLGEIPKTYNCTSLSVWDWQITTGGLYRKTGEPAKLIKEFHLNELPKVIQLITLYDKGFEALTDDVAPVGSRIQSHMQLSRLIIDYNEVAPKAEIHTNKYRFYPSFDGIGPSSYQHGFVLTRNQVLWGKQEIGTINHGKSSPYELSISFATFTEPKSVKYSKRSVSAPDVPTIYSIELMLYVYQVASEAALGLTPTPDPMYVVAEFCILPDGPYSNEYLSATIYDSASSGFKLNSETKETTLFNVKLNRYALEAQEGAKFVGYNHICFNKTLPWDTDEIAKKQKLAQTQPDTYFIENQSFLMSLSLEKDGSYLQKVVPVSLPVKGNHEYVPEEILVKQLNDAKTILMSDFLFSTSFCVIYPHRYQPVYTQKFESSDLFLKHVQQKFIDDAIGYIYIQAAGDGSKNFQIMGTICQDLPEATKKITIEFQSQFPDETQEKCLLSSAPVYLPTEERKEPAGFAFNYSRVPFCKLKKSEDIYVILTLDAKKTLLGQCRLQKAPEIEKVSDYCKGYEPKLIDIAVVQSIEYEDVTGAPKPIFEDYDYDAYVNTSYVDTANNGESKNVVIGDDPSQTDVLNKHASATEGTSSSKTLLIGVVTAGIILPVLLAGSALVYYMIRYKS